MRPVFQKIALIKSGVLVLIVFALGFSAVSFATDAVKQVPGDELMGWVQATGFPTWAIAVVWMGRQLIGQLKDISDRLDRHVTQTEQRITRLEEILRYRTERLP